MPAHPLTVDGAVAPFAETVVQILDRAVADGIVPGAMVAIGNSDGLVCEVAAGWCDLERTTPACAGTQVWLASLTKALTSTGALQLIERGLIALDQPVRDILPAFGNLQVLDGFDGDSPRFRPPASEATIRQLLTHTSGLAYHFGNADILRLQKSGGKPDCFSGRREAIELCLAHDPGTYWEYGVSTDWLGLVIEAVTGTDLPAYLDGHVFEPLGMSGTSFLRDGGRTETTMAMTKRSADGLLSNGAVPLARSPEFHSGGAGAFGTGPDYLRFLRAWLRGGELDGARILAEQTVANALTDHAGGVIYPQGFTSQSPELANSMPPFPIKEGWGLGFHLVQQDLPGMRRAGSADWAGVPNNYYWLDPSSNVACVLLTQVLPGNDPRILKVFGAIERAIYSASPG